LLDGGSGDDRLELTMASESQAALRGSIGDDTIVAVLTAARGSVRVSGGSGNDALTVSGGRRNWLDGGAGEDEIQGGGRSDTIIGGTLDDTLSGGGGADRFVFYAFEFEFGHDTITDFGRSEDVLVFGIADENGNGLLDELDQLAAIEDQGVGGDVVVDFGFVDRLIFSGLGTGEVDSFADLVDDPSTQLVSGLLV
jgi:Ca2+-binding RTX toxin-like protein